MPVREPSSMRPMVPAYFRTSFEGISRAKLAYGRVAAIEISMGPDMSEFR